MSWQELRVRLYFFPKAMTLWSVLWGAAAPLVHSQEHPAPPTPHKGPILPGTHVAPRLVSQKPGIVLRIDGPATVNQKKCARQTFDIRYSVINNTAAPANGVIRASFNGVLLTPVGSAKLHNLPPGKQASGMFTACCPASGSFTARMDYDREAPSTAHDKTAENAYSVSDSLNISCR